MHRFLGQCKETLEKWDWGFRVEEEGEKKREEEERPEFLQSIAHVHPPSPWDLPTLRTQVLLTQVRLLEQSPLRMWIPGKLCKQAEEAVAGNRSRWQQQLLCSDPNFRHCNLTTTPLSLLSSCHCCYDSFFLSGEQHSRFWAPSATCDTPPFGISLSLSLSLCASSALSCMQKKRSLYDQIDLLLKNRYRLTRLPNERGEEMLKEASMRILSEAGKKHLCRKLFESSTQEEEEEESAAAASATTEQANAAGSDNVKWEQ